MRQKTHNRSSVFYYNKSTWYKGGQPAFFDNQDLPACQILRDNYEVIKTEILDYYNLNADSLKDNYTPYSIAIKGWKAVNLYTLFLKYPKNCQKFPRTDRIINKIPGMTMAMISVMEPGTEIPPHIGDTDGIIRHHLGISVPVEDPTHVGIKIRSETRGWREGEVLSFCNVHRHCAWNRSSQYRIVLMVDTIREDLTHRKYEIASNTLAVITMKQFATKAKILKKIPAWVISIFQISFSYLFRVILYIERKFGVHIFMGRG